MEVILTFGKFKGQRFCDTPKWYQNWLNNQSWFAGFISVNCSASVQPTEAGRDLHKRLAGWNGHSSNGQAIYDQIFEQEKEEMEKHDPSDRYGHYYGI